MSDPIRPWIIEVRELAAQPQGSRVVRTYPGVMAVTAQGALAHARDRWGHTLGRDQWLTIGLPGQRK